MKVCQVRQAANLLLGLPESQGVNLTLWRNTNYVTLSFMAVNGEVRRYKIYEDGTVAEDQL
jgi:hypothetical protein